MNLIDKRKDAAHTLVVPYDATPDMVNQAYERRMHQRFSLQNDDYDAYVRGIENLYDARIRMKISADNQWLAQLRLMATSRVDKMNYALMAVLKLARRDAKSPLSQVVIDDLIKTVPRLYRKYNILRGIVAYEFGGLGGMMVYDHVSPEHGPIVPMIAYGSMLVAAFAMAWVMDSIERDKTRIAAFSKLLSFDKLFQNEK